jgi:peptidoglycan/LPS O-acetylase OafA/YrhL
MHRESTKSGIAQVTSVPGFKGSNYMPQLDGLRALAVIGVLAQHYMPSMSGFGLGHYGVLLFFVLSGYLISGILFRCREEVERGAGVLATAKRFYIRRTLRIFPIYYLLIFALWKYGYTAVREPILWHLTYTTNIYVAILGVHLANIIGHIWSLAVEEQFYLIWPWIILYTPRQYFPRALLFMVLLGPGWRLFCELVGISGTAVMVLPISCLDSLAMGALLAYVKIYGSIGKFRSDQIQQLVLRFGLPLLFVLVAGEVLFGRGPVVIVFRDFASALVFGGLVVGAANGFQGLFGRVLSLNPLAFTGKISYGIYLYHMPVLYLVRQVLGKVGIPWNLTEPEVFVLCSACTIVIAAASWHLIEKPINGMKRFFEYDPPRAK